MPNKQTDSQQFIEDIGGGVFSKQDKPVFSIKIVKEELLLDEIIQDFKAKVIELLPDNPVRIGTFTA